jgi:hypothetical protein
MKEPSTCADRPDNEVWVEVGVKVRGCGAKGGFVLPEKWRGIDLDSAPLNFWNSQGFLGPMNRS